jgi:hypothetical protein
MNTSETAKRIEFLLSIVPEKVSEIAEEDMSFRRAPDKWSKKELMGHLCDSAINNLSRFIGAQFETKPFAVNAYNQDDWVKGGHYQEMQLHDIISFWISANTNIINVISNYDPEHLLYECFMEDGDFGNYVKEEKPSYYSDGGKRTMHWLIDDYVAHLEYHLHQLIDY